jgi:hypothetical protein
MFRRPLLAVPVLIAAIALPVTPAFAGEEEDGDTGPAKLRATQGCVSGDRARAVVTGNNIETVEFFVDGNRVDRVTRPDANGRFVLSMRCSRLSFGAHRASAIVTFTEEASRARQALRYQVTRARQVSPRFTG